MMKRKIQMGVSALLCLLLGFGAGAVSSQKPMTWIIEQRSDQEVSLPEKVTAPVSLYPGCEDYSAVTALQPEMVQKINQQLGDLLPRRATLEDVQAGEYYRIYLTHQDLYRLRTTRQLVAALEQGDQIWECYLTVEEVPILVRLRTVPVEQKGQPVRQPQHWIIQWVERVGYPRERVGYDAAIQAGLQAGGNPDVQAFLVSNDSGLTVCLLCSDTIDTMVTVGQTNLSGTPSFVNAVLQPGTQPVDGVFRFSKVAALAQSFQPVLDLSALWEGRWIGIPSQDSITQRTGLPAWATGLLMAGILLAAAASAGVWHGWKKRR